jgi:hypothetical protein
VLLGEKLKLDGFVYKSSANVNGKVIRNDDYFVISVRGRPREP